MSIIFITADWCGHCQRFYPELNKLKKALDKKQISYKHLKDGENSDEISTIKNFQGYPTILIGGEVYDGPRDAKTLYKKIKVSNTNMKGGAKNKNMDVLMDYFKNNFYMY